ncbi:LytR/AlgR family response regulator transcription factor [Pedobacter immunditicola]|uniref:LytR/AlgR family response regulator transcription factor n=1 Tax=Pedobacter immunditicola TaxID=3133440 RepID=UPI0030ADC08A
MKILIIEDEQRNANRLESLLHEIDADIVVVDVLESVADSIEWFSANKEPDLILMDVRLADGLCFEIFSACSVKSPVIFTTAYDEYAIRAFKVNSVDYLLKPIDKQELASALTKHKHVFSVTQSEAMINNLVEIIRKPGAVYRSRFLIPIHDGYKTINVDDIAYIYSEFKVSNLVLENGEVQAVLFTMDELEEQLNADHFFRANRQHLISINSIKTIHNFFNGKLKVVLNGLQETEVFISREKASIFKHWLDR